MTTLGSNPSDTKSDRSDPSDNEDHSLEVAAQAVGVLQDGTRFNVPETQSVMVALVSPSSLKSTATQLWIMSILLTTFSLYLYTSGWLPGWFFVGQFLFWRLGYNAGLGWLLHTQSNGKAFVKYYQDKIKNVPANAKLLESVVVFKDSTEYKMSNRHPILSTGLRDSLKAFLAVLVFWQLRANRKKILRILKIPLQQIRSACQTILFKIPQLLRCVAATKFFTIK